MANNVDPDQTPRTAASDLGLYCLLRSVFPNTWSKYGYFIKMNRPSPHPSEIILDPPLTQNGLFAEGLTDIRATSRKMALRAFCRISL